MTVRKPTPGKWMCADNRIREQLADGTWDEIPAFSISTQDGWIVAYIPQYVNEHDSNSRVICMAPEMYAALRAAHSSLRTFSPTVPQDEQGWTDHDENTRLFIERVLNEIEGGDV